MGDKKKVVRDAGTGQFTGAKNAKKRPRSTVTEEVPVVQKGKGKKAVKKSGKKTS